jgi:hypothetical protein
MNGVNFKNRQGNGIVTADGFSTSTGVNTPKTVVSTTITFDPPSLATAAIAISSGITVTGVALGDHVELYPPYDTQGVAVQAQASAVNTIVISLHNRNTITVDLASGTWGVVVKRRT